MSTSIAMNLAKEQVQLHQWFAMNHASLNATRAAMNFGMFDRDEDRNKQDNIFECEKRMKCNKQSKETCMFGSLRLIRLARDYQSFAKEVKKRNQ